MTDHQPLPVRTPGATFAHNKPSCTHATATPEGWATPILRPSTQQPINNSNTEKK